MFPLPRRPRSASPVSSRRRSRGFTLVEAIVATGVAAVLFAAVTTQMVESTRMSLRITRTLEHSRNAREFLDVLAADVRTSQLVRIHPGFSDRSSVARDGQTGNYLVLHRIDTRGNITRTIGYYLAPRADGRGWTLHRHDSAAGDTTAGTLPGASSAGRHAVISHAVRLQPGAPLFQCAHDRGVTILGEFGTSDTAGDGRTEYVRCTLSTRS
jgi:type II secretory pathway pseudopilin PulG